MKIRQNGPRKLLPLGSHPRSNDIIRRRNNSPETRRLVEQRNTLSRPGTLRRRYDHQTERTVFAPSRPNKRSSEEIAETDAELIRRANRLGGLEDGLEDADIKNSNRPEANPSKNQYAPRRQRNHPGRLPHSFRYTANQVGPRILRRTNRRTH